MEDVLQFEVGGSGLKRYGDTLKQLIMDWLVEENGLDILISILSLGEIGMINIDCYYEKNNKMKIEKLTKEILEKLHIDYKIILE